MSDNEKLQAELNNSYANNLAQIGLRQLQINDIQADMQQFYNAISNLKIDSDKLAKKVAKEASDNLEEDKSSVSDAEVVTLSEAQADGNP